LEGHFRGLIVPGENRQAHAGREKQRCQNGCCAGQRACLAASSHEAAAPAHAKGTALGALQEYDHDKHDDDHEMNDDQDRLHGKRLWSNSRDALYRQAAATARVGAAIVVIRRLTESREIRHFLSILDSSCPSRVPCRGAEAWPLLTRAMSRDDP
jgi:hypothetical protein